MGQQMYGSSLKVLFLLLLSLWLSLLLGGESNKNYSEVLLVLISSSNFCSF